MKEFYRRLPMSKERAERAANMWNEIKQTHLELIAAGAVIAFSKEDKQHAMAFMEACKQAAGIPEVEQIEVLFECYKELRVRLADGRLIVAKKDRGAQQ